MGKAIDRLEGIGIMKNDCISRQAAIDAIFGRSHEIIKMRIGNLPSAQPERMRGKWEKGVGENGVTTSLFCSECNYENTHWYAWNYCPNCGADMRGEQDG